MSWPPQVGHATPFGQRRQSTGERNPIIEEYDGFLKCSRFAHEPKERNQMKTRLPKINADEPLEMERRESRVRYFV